MKYLLIISTLLLSIASCCPKENKTEQKDLVPEKLITIKDEIADTTYISYQDNNYLDQITNSTGIIDFEYESGRLKEQKYHNKGESIPYSKFVFIYDSEGKVEYVDDYLNANYSDGKWISEMSDTFRITNRFEYVYSGNMATRINCWEDNSGDTLYYIGIEYDQRGNVSSRSYYIKAANGYENLWTFNYEFDSKNHYFKNVNYIDVINIEPFVNNIVREEKIFYDYPPENDSISEPGISLLNCTYQYNEHDYPVSMINEEEEIYIIYR